MATRASLRNLNNAENPIPAKTMTATSSTAMTTRAAAAKTKATRAALGEIGNNVKQLGKRYFDCPCIATSLRLPFCIFFDSSYIALTF